MAAAAPDPRGLAEYPAVKMSGVNVLADDLRRLQPELHDLAPWIIKLQNFQSLTLPGRQRGRSIDATYVINRL